MRKIGGIAAALVALAPPAQAGSGEIKVVDIKAYVFLEHAGRLSDNLVGAAEALVNAPRGGAPGGDTATALLVDLTFAGEGAPSAGAAPAPTGKGAPKLVTATVDLTQTGRGGERIVTHRAFDVAFGPEGVAHKAVFLEGATCMPLAIEVRAGRSVKQAKLDFTCDVVRAPS